MSHQLQIVPVVKPSTESAANDTRVAAGKDFLKPYRMQGPYEYDPITGWVDAMLQEGYTLKDVRA